ncbi:MAG TPA: ATP-dependent Clp protease adapter ClpS [Blastocatellia bacterium]|nr:ATP-dependent Clp protease adapter ClpS [Blastocatellia bacterium]
MPQWEDEQEGAVQTESKQKLQKPPLYKVLLHNDDYTTMEFVVYILERVFHKSEADAFRIMMAVHQQGVGVAGVYTYEIAEAKVEKVHSLARASEYPLLCTIEEE